jgi:hypothetical protein
MASSVVHEDWQLPSIRKDSPDWLYCSMILRAPIGPPLEYGREEPSARTKAGQASAARQLVNRTVILFTCSVLEVGFEFINRSHFYE